MLQLAGYTGEEARSPQYGPIHEPNGRPRNSKHQPGPFVRQQQYLQERNRPGHNLFVPKLDPPSRFSDAFELSPGNRDIDRDHQPKANHRDFVIAV